MEAALTPSTEKEPKSLDDVMLAMDIVDTLRHRERVLDKELSTEERETKLIERLREIYSAQGIKVPDHILKDGVQALEEKRFTYNPPKDSFSIKLAHAYVNRGRWLKPIGLVVGIAAFATGIYEFGIDGPREAKQEAQQIELTQSIPQSLASARDSALALAATDNARTRLETTYQNGTDAARNGDITQARAALSTLEDLKSDLSKTLSIRVLSEPGERSGVFRIPDDVPDARNYYLIVEAVDAGGTVASLEIASEEDRSVKRVKRWGVRVTEGEFNRIAADKQDDQIIQNAVIGSKSRGALVPTYTVNTAGGNIVEW